MAVNAGGTGPFRFLFKPLEKPKAETKLAGTFCYFDLTGHNLGRPTYGVRSRRGGIGIAHIEWRNQWNAWAVFFRSDTPVNAEIIAEIYAFLRRPEVTPQRAPWRAAVRDWVIKWL